MIVKVLALGLVLLVLPFHASAQPFLSDVLLDVGDWVPGAGSAEYHQIHLRGMLGGDNGNLMGLVIELTNDSPSGYGSTGSDTARGRGVIGTVTTTGPGSVRFLHGHGIGLPGSTGPVNAVTAQITCPTGSPNCRNIEVAATGDGATRGIEFTSSGPGHFSYLINATAAQTDNAFVLLPTGAPGGRVMWSGGGSIYSPAPNVVLIEGTLQNATISALLDRIRALEERLGAAPPSPPSSPPAPPPPPPPPPPMVIPPLECRYVFMGACIP